MSYAVGPLGWILYHIGNLVFILNNFEAHAYLSHILQLPGAAHFHCPSSL